MAMKSFNFAFIFLMTITPMVLSIREDFPVLKSVEEIEAKFRVSSLTDCVPHNDPPACKLSDKIRRRIDGSCNNLDNRKFGAANTPLLTPVGKRYFDLAGLDIPPNHVALQEFSLIPSADSVSRQLFSGVNADDEGGPVSLMFMTFGQFLDHDLSLTPYSEERVQTDCKEIDDFVFPRYPMFDVASFGTTCRSFFRSFAVCQDPQKPRRVRDHPTTITAFVDASNVYGSSEKLLEELRDPADPKLLKVTNGANDNPLDDLLPIINSAACLNNRCFEAGDERASENIALTAMHTIFVREHNRIAKELKKIHFNDVTWDDNVIFFTAKRIVGMLMQKIVYKEWLPELVTLPAYKGYDSNINPGIIDGFSTAAYRFGHSLVRNNWPRRDGNLKETVFPRNLPLRNTFLNITELEVNGIEEIVFGFLREAANDFDPNFANGIFRQLFNNVEETNSFFSNFRQSLITRNIHRGRDHGLRDYLTWRNRYPELIDGFGDIKQSKVHELLRVYRNQRENVDLFVGGILETKRLGSLVGPTFEAIIKEQFTNLRDGDRFYYENVGGPIKQAEINEINKDSMSRVLCTNLQGLNVAPKKPFRFNSADSSFIACNSANFPAANLEVFERLDFV